MSIVDKVKNRGGWQYNLVLDFVGVCDIIRIKWWLKEDVKKEVDKISSVLSELIGCFVECGFNSDIVECKSLKTYEPR